MAYTLAMPMSARGPRSESTRGMLEREFAPRGAYMDESASRGGSMAATPVSASGSHGERTPSMQERDFTPRSAYMTEMPMSARRVQPAGTPTARENEWLPSGEFMTAMPASARGSRAPSRGSSRSDPAWRSSVEQYGQRPPLPMPATSAKAWAEQLQDFDGATPRHVDPSTGAMSLDLTRTLYRSGPGFERSARHDLSANLDKDRVRSVTGVVAARHILSEGGNDLHKSMATKTVYDRDALHFTRRSARDPCEHVRPAGAVDGHLKRWSLKGGIHSLGQSSRR
eukprot:TRINITY_DN38725_c0_g1_i1.p1 TRINITY_DN38725_c0_g1~~TRINITY_DN38725_c0_g1_i1.p1  ORF type:complete len:283 (+),score=35.09 TRINITY_DN38725_c0_g1_i1:76-924(+)